MLLPAKLVVFLYSVISKGKVVALDRWAGKWNHPSMTHRLTTIYAECTSGRAYATALGMSVVCRRRLYGMYCG